MAVYDNLPVYKATYDLLIAIFRLNDNLTKQYKYTLGAEIKKELMELLVAIYQANIGREKETHLRHAKEKIVTAKLYVRLLHDLGQINQKRFVALSDQVEDVAKQLTSWYKSAVSKENREKAIIQNN